MELMEANGHTGENRVGAAVSIRDLEVAVVLAREMTTASSRAVEASLRADQIQEVFGAAALDDAERARIQTALEMAGLQPTPSMLEVEQRRRRALHRQSRGRRGGGGSARARARRPARRRRSPPRRRRTGAPSSPPWRSS